MWICCRYKIKPHFSHFYYVTLFPLPHPFSIYIQDPSHLLLFEVLCNFFNWEIKGKNSIFILTALLSSQALNIPHRQLACKFNQITQLCFTLQKLRYQSTLVKLGTTEAPDKPFTKTNGKTLSTRVCSNTVKFLLNRVTLIISILSSIWGTTYISISFYPHLQMFFFF